MAKVEIETSPISRTVTVVWPECKHRMKFHMESEGPECPFCENELLAHSLASLTRKQEARSPQWKYSQNPPTKADYYLTKRSAYDSPSITYYTMHDGWGPTARVHLWCPIPYDHLSEGEKNVD